MVDFFGVFLRFFMKVILKVLDWLNKFILIWYYERDMDFICLIKRKNYILRKKVLIFCELKSYVFEIDF